jgi:hypothetical protein
MLDPKWQTQWSVTRVLNASGLYGDLRFVPAEALRRGTIIHEATAQWDQGMGPARLAPDYNGWYEAYKRWCREMSPDFTHIEHAFDRVTPDGGFHGIVDRVIHPLGGTHADHDRVVLDIKTGPPKASDPIQTAAYTIGLFPQSWKRCKRACLYIRQDGTYRLRAYTDPHDFLTWRSLLENALEEHNGNHHPDRS